MLISYLRSLLTDLLLMWLHEVKPWFHYWYGRDHEEVAFFYVAT